MATEPLQSALPPRPQGATGAQEDASGNLRWHDGYGKDLGPADDSGAPQDTPQAAPKAASANPFDDAPQANDPFATAPKAASANPFDDAPQATAPKKGWGRRALDAFEENPGMGIASGLPSTVDALVNGKPLPHNLVGSLTDTAMGAGKVISSVVHGEGKQAAQQMLDLLPQANKDRAEMTMNAAGEALSGHLGQAAQDMTKEEISKFVTPGSLIEKGIQTFSPKFKGTAALPEALQAPIVDVASNIDKNDHPVGKAIAENIQGLTSIQSLVTLAATDGVGLVKGPLSDVLKSSTGRNVASRMMSLGFSADAVMAAVQHSKSAYDAFMKGDNNEAEYELTHGVTSGTFAALAGTHAAGSDAPGKIVDKAVDVAKGALDTLSAPFKGDDLGTMYNQLSAPSKSMNKGGRFDDKVKTALPALSETIDQNPDISTPQEFGKAIDNYRTQRDGSILSKAAELRGTPAVEMTGIEDEVIKGIKQHFDENPGQYTKEEQNEALNKVVDHIRQEKILNGQQRFDAEPDLFEAEGVRQRFNQDTAPSYDGTKEVVPAAEAAAKKIAANVLRTAIDAKYDELGISGVREWRQQEAALIDVRDAISAQSQKAVQMGQFGAWKTFVGQLKWKTAALAAAGAGGFGFGGEHGLIGGLVAGTGGMLADVFHEWLVDQRKNPNVMVQKIINKSVEANEKIKAQGGKINPASPEFGPAKPKPILPPMQGADNQAAVTGVRLDPVTHMPIDAQGNIIPKNPPSLRSPIERALENGSGTIPTGSGVMAPTDERMDVPMTRMPEGFDQDAFHHHELAHHANAVAEGIRTSDIASHQHPDLAGSTAAGGLGYDEKPLIRQRNATEKFTPEELLEDMRKWLAQYAAGAVGNELIDGIPIHQNEGLVGDIRQMKELLKRHGIEGDGAIQEIEGAIQRARKNLSNPGILDSIKSNAQVREENLHPTLHYSRGRLMGIAEELRGLNEEPNPTGTEGQRQGGKPDSSGAPQTDTGRRAADAANGPEGRQAAQGDSGRVGTANDRPQVTYKPSEKAATMSAERKDYGPEFEAAQREHEIDRNKKILRNSAATDADRADAVARLADLQNPETNQARSYVETDTHTPAKPKERTTGDPERDEMIRQAGGVPAGTMKGDPSIGLPEYTLFHEPESGSTLALKTKDLSPERITQHIADKQAEYAAAAKRSPLEAAGPRDRYDMRRMLDQTPEEAHAERMRDLGSALQDKFDEMENKDSGRSPLQGEWQPPKGLEQGISKDDAIATDIPLNKLSVSEHAYNGAASNYFRKNGSKTEGPISVVYENGQYKVEDGMHRLVQAHQEGKTTIPAKIWSGYSDSASVLPENKMDLSPIDDEDGERSPLEGDRVSTRVTAGKKATEDHMQGEPLIINRAAMDDRLREKFAGKIADVAGVKVPKNITDPDKITDRAVRHFADNLKHIYGTVPPEQQIANGKWYESAHNMTKDIAEKNGFSHSQIAGATAALSPQMDWDMNVTQMKRLVDTVKNQGDTPVSPEMIAKGEDIIKRSRAPQKGSAKPANQRLEGIIQNIGGKTLNQLDDLYDKAAFVRLHDETYGSSNFPRIDPATGEERELRTNNDGSPSKLAWGNLDNISKALSILQDGSRANVSDNIGDSHKVRNFYNNIIDPSNPDDVTIDTHAVGAATLLPVGGDAPEVLDNFGKAGKSVATGVKGTYPIYADAYRLAAKELGVLPRSLQSVTWEKVRQLFPAEWKTEDNLKAVKNIWKQHEKGNLTGPEARKQITDMASTAQDEVANVRAAKLAAANKKLDINGGLSYLSGTVKK